MQRSRQFFDRFLGIGLAIMFSGVAHSAMADEIKIGEINSYSLLPAFTEPYRKGCSSRSMKSMPPAASTATSSWWFPRTTAASCRRPDPPPTSWCRSEKVVMLTGTFLSNIGLAVSDFANQKKVFFLAAEPLTDAITWAKGNRYTFRLRHRITCRRRCWWKKPPSCRPSAGRRSRRTTNMASPRSRCSRS